MVALSEEVCIYTHAFPGLQSLRPDSFEGFGVAAPMTIINITAKASKLSRSNLLSTLKEEGSPTI